MFRPAKPVSFITHFLKLCGVKMKDFKSFNISQRELENFCHGLKGNLEEQYVRFWKDHAGSTAKKSRKT